MSWCRTYRMPCRHNRSGTGFGPGDRSGQGGSNGSTSAHKRSFTTHPRVVTRRERSNHHIGHARPGRLNTILLRALTGLPSTGDCGHGGHVLVPFPSPSSPWAVPHRWPVHAGARRGIAQPPLRRRCEGTTRLPPGGSAAAGRCRVRLPERRVHRGEWTRRLQSSSNSTRSTDTPSRPSSNVASLAKPVAPA